MATTSENKRAINRLYSRYEYLALAYARKVYNEDRLGMERADVEQEFKLKLWYSIGKFIKRWKVYQDTGKYKPVPLPFFLKSVLNKLVIDMSKEINSYFVDASGNKSQGMRGMISMQDAGFDMGKSVDPLTSINLSGKQQVIVRGIDILEGLSKRERVVYCLHLKGYPLKTIRKLVPELEVATIITNQTQHLRQYQTELLENDSQTMMVYSSVDDETN